MTGFDHTEFAYTHWAPYEPDTDGTEVQVEPMAFDADPTVALGADDPAQLSPLYGTEDGVETLTAWSTAVDGNAEREPGDDFPEW